MQPEAQLTPLERRFLTTSKEHEVNEQARITAIAIERTRASRFLNVALFVANIFAIAFLIILLQNRANLATASCANRIRSIPGPGLRITDRTRKRPHARVATGGSSRTVR
ncbi:MAG: hypothetical protein IPK53_11440 [bacterium]|nr:hypothetical protein [bacterium]